MNRHLVILALLALTLAVLAPEEGLGGETTARAAGIEAASGKSVGSVESAVQGRVSSDHG